MSNWYTETIRKDPRFHSVNACYDTGLLEPTFRAAVTAVLADMTANGETFHVGETYRSKERQLYLFHKGRTQLSRVGVHHFGLACDMIRLVKGVYDAVGPHYVVLRPSLIAHKLVWGATWGEPDKPHAFRDWDHVQRVDLGDQPGLFSGAWYPDPDWEPALVG